jgi:hypothetical protein
MRGEGGEGGIRGGEELGGGIILREVGHEFGEL